MSMTPQQFIRHMRATAHSQIKVKVGKTNGQQVFHVATVGEPKLSRTITGEGGWRYHPAHEDNRPAKGERESRSEAAA